MRIKGSGSEWVILRCIEKNKETIGEWVKFLVTKKGPKNPC